MRGRWNGRAGQGGVELPGQGPQDQNAHALEAVGREIDTVDVQVLEIDLIDADVAHGGAPFGCPLDVAEDAPVEMISVSEE